MRVRPVCAYCGQHPVNARWRPFCCERCKMADLGRWLNGDYRIAGTSPEPPDAAATEEEEDDS